MTGLGLGSSLTWWPSDWCCWEAGWRWRRYGAAGQYRPPGENTAPRPQINWLALGYLGLALLLNLVLLERAGFVISASLLFWLVARAFHSRRPARDAATAVLLSVLVYFAFTRGLGLILPLGIFNRLF